MARWDGRGWQAWRAFGQAYDVHWSLVEARVYHERLRYAGTLDLIADFPGANTSLVLFLDQSREHQHDRLLAFLNPELDSRGAGYNVTQAQIAIGGDVARGKP